ncbi:hypothetical protein LSH36_241g04000 [Paralvinella palmiformis]|uniref:Uncharacterized protein n=1 Tax=Paralvinella palmiformis TaxID=53620 RepID=A0AAD9JMX3_9ANNE|nr:hypothetical protein LSH36_241g04000 [Paralvinella palmiformis]
MEPKYPEGGHCQSPLHARESLTSPLFLIKSLDTAAPFNVVSYPRCCELRNLSLEMFRRLSGVGPVTLGTKYQIPRAIIPLVNGSFPVSTDENGGDEPDSCNVQPYLFEPKVDESAIEDESTDSLVTDSR